MMKKSITLLLVPALFAVAHTSASAKPAARSSATEMRELTPPVPGAITVSDYEFNTFVFPEPVKKILTPAGSPIVGDPIYVNGNTTVLLQLGKAVDKRPAQVIVELQSGQVSTLWLVPSSIHGITYKVSKQKFAEVPSASSADKSATGEGDGPPSTEQNGKKDLELLKILVSTGAPPDGFDPIPLPAVVKFDKFSVVPLAGWSNGSKRVFAMSLVANPGETAVVSPPQFYRKGISAVTVSSDVVDAQHSPQLFVVEDINDE